MTKNARGKRARNIIAHPRTFAHGERKEAPFNDDIAWTVDLEPLMFLTAEQTHVLDNLSLVTKGAYKRASGLPDYLLQGASCRRQIVSLLAKKIIRQEEDGTLSRSEAAPLRHPNRAQSDKLGDEIEPLVERAETALADVGAANGENVEDCAKIRDRARVRNRSEIREKVDRMLSL